MHVRANSMDFHLQVRAAPNNQTEYVAQKAKRKAEKKARKEAERQRVVEKEKKKRRMLEYLQQL